MSGYNLKKKCNLLSKSEDFFYLYSVDPDEMQHYGSSLFCKSSIGPVKQFKHMFWMLKRVPTTYVLVEK